MLTLLPACTALAVFIPMTCEGQTPRYSVSVRLLKPSDTSNYLPQNVYEHRIFDATQPQVADLHYFTSAAPLPFQVLLRGRAESAKGWAASSSANLIWDRSGTWGTTYAGSFAESSSHDHFTIAKEGKEGMQGIATVLVHSQTTTWGTEGVGGGSNAQAHISTYSIAPNQPVEVPFVFGTANSLILQSSSHRGISNWLGSKSYGGYFYSLPWISSNTVYWGGILNVRLAGEPAENCIDLDSLAITSASGFDYRSAAVPAAPPTHDGVLRPEIRIRKGQAGAWVIDFTGTLESSGNLQDWAPLDPQPESPYTVTPSPGARFFRASVEEDE